MAIGSFSTGAVAETFSISGGTPVSHSFSSKWSNSNDPVESDGVSGFMLHVKLPVGMGVGIETYETQVTPQVESSTPDLKLVTNMYDLFYLLPFPVVNITLGVGAGNVKLDCAFVDGTVCGDYWDAGGIGSTTQLWGQFGFPIIPLIDIHVSYHSVSSEVKGKENNPDLKFNGTVIGIGAALIF